MDQLLGFVVLTGPLFLIVLWVPVCIALAIWVGRKAIKKNLSIRIVGGLLVFILALFLPVADEIAGRIYFNHLCETEAGAKVYQTIELPAEYWDEDGKPKFYDTQNGNFYLNWDDLVDAKLIKTKRILNVVEMKSVLKKKGADDLISEKIWFGYGGGWLIDNFSPAPSGSSCGRSVTRTLSEYAETFKPIDKLKGVNNGNDQ